MALNGKNKRTPIPAAILHQVYLRDEGRCAYYDHKGWRCSSKRFLEVHHKKPVSLGGGNEVSNLLLTCSGHHKVMHRGGPIGHKTQWPQGLVKTNRGKVSLTSPAP